MKKIDIYEEDIFNYVFYPEKLSGDKREYIDKNINAFTEQIELCKSLPNPEDIGTLLRQSENDLKILKIITLNPVVLPKNNNGSTRSLAAESEEKETQYISTNTFISANGVFLLKQMNYSDHTELYLLTDDGSDTSKYRVTLHPADEVILMNVNSKPAILSQKPEISSVSVYKKI